MKVCVEMGTKEFTLTTLVATFQTDEGVDITPVNGIALTGRVVSCRIANYGRPPVSSTRIKIAITSSNIVRHNNKSLGGATVRGTRSKTLATIYDKDSQKFNYPMVKLQYIEGVVKEIETLVKQATQVKNDTLARQLFGDNLTKVQLQRIHYDALALREGLAAVRIMRFVCKPTPWSGSYIASCDLNIRESCKPTLCEVRLGDGFTWDRYSWGEKVCSIIHEMSHWFLGTKDEDYNGEKAYGIKAFDMANDPSKVERRKCLNNAENWGYYICSYRDITKGNDWRNMTPKELTIRVPINTTVQKVNPAVIHPV